MPKPGPRFIQDYILPALDVGKYGEYLHWVNRNEGIFRIKWQHKNSAQWTADDAVVFTDWDRLKLRTEEVGDVEYYMKAKQRFRAALSKLEVEVLERNDNGYRTYKFNDCHLRNISHNKENVRPVINNQNPRIPVASTSNAREDENRRIPAARNAREEENNHISVTNDVDRNAAEILVMLSGKRQRSETYVPGRPNVHYIQAHHSNAQQPNAAIQDEHEDTHMEEEDATGMQEQDNIVQHVPMQPSVPRQIKIMTEAPLMFVVPTYNDF